MTRNPYLLKLATPIREGSKIYVITADGEKIRLDPMQAKLQAEEWGNVVMGAYVFQMMQPRDDSEGE